jgi:hypothetical protein
MKTNTSQPKNHIPQLVERGFAIHQQLSILNEEFKQIKEQLKAKAVASPGERVPLSDKESEGDQWIAKGSGCECRIVFPAPKIKTDLDPLQPDFKTIKLLTGDQFHSLFHRIVSYEPADKATFRDSVSHLLAESAAAQLLDLCTSPSEPKAFWKARPAPEKGKAA